MKNENSRKMALAANIMNQVISARQENSCLSVIAIKDTDYEDLLDILTEYLVIARKQQEEEDKK